MIVGTISTAISEQTSFVFRLLKIRKKNVNLEIQCINSKMEHEIRCDTGTHLN